MTLALWHSRTEAAWRLWLIINVNVHGCVFIVGIVLVSVVVLDVFVLAVFTV